MRPVLNVSAYRFVDLDDLPALRQRLLSTAAAAGLKGTVLLAPEGINLFLAGATEAVRGWLVGLREDPRFAGLDAKESTSSEVPFRRLLVKIKREIIRMNHPTIRPAGGRAPAIDPPTLARWLAQGRCDAGRPLVLLDTRNGFEVDAGAFEGAIDWRLQKFSDFPAALDTHRATLEGKTVVSYCTGGIRCEKAALLMAERGLRHVLQLDGGVLRYFEQTSGAPGWRGDCFVFDDRVALEPTLQPSSTAGAGAAP
ncbi:sulfurtransferase [Rubrivivax sp. RP6-9]|uniref:sulfurtransferase n=1 Tax=Rubrivivax sp. RP6-9 TaxID=3415750 RepID=UPI003CC641AF